MKNAHYMFPEPTGTFSSILFSLTISPQPIGIQFTVIEDSENLVE